MQANLLGLQTNNSMKVTYYGIIQATAVRSVLILIQIERFKQSLPFSNDYHTKLEHKKTRQLFDRVSKYYSPTAIKMRESHNRISRHKVKDFEEIKPEDVIRI